MKALTPPPLNRPLNVPYMGNPAKIIMPNPRSVEKAMLYAEGLDDQGYVKKFLQEFEKSGKATVFTDVIGEKVIISDDLFKTTSGRLKIHKEMRYRHLGILAQTIKDPDEIWYVWEEYPKGRMTLRKKYLARWTVDGKSVPAFVLFDTAADGWAGITAFPAKNDKYFEKQRNGALVYRRQEK